MIINWNFNKVLVFAGLLLFNSCLKNKSKINNSLQHELTELEIFHNLLLLCFVGMFVTDEFSIIGCLGRCIALIKYKTI